MAGARGAEPAVAGGGPKTAAKEGLSLPEIAARSRAMDRTLGSDCSRVAGEDVVGEAGASLPVSRALRATTHAAATPPASRGSHASIENTVRPRVAPRRPDARRLRSGPLPRSMT